MKVYKLGLVGESNYQAAIGRCHAGESVRVCHEIDNPHDDLALRVESNVGELIGYIARSSWLREAIHEEGRGVAATICSIGTGDTGLMGVVLDVTLTDDPVFERNYQKPAPMLRPARSRPAPDSRQPPRMVDNTHPPSPKSDSQIGRSVGAFLRGLMR